MILRRTCWRSLGRQRDPTADRSALTASAAANCLRRIRPFRLNELRQTLSGPLGKRASFNVNAVILNPLTLAITPFTDTPVAELRRTLLTPGVDVALSQNHTLSVRYSYSRDILRNAGTGGLNLVSPGRFPRSGDSG